MAYDEKTADRVRRILAGRRGVAEKRMMGALCFMVNGSMCCGVAGQALMVRVGREAHRRMVALPHVRPMEIGGRRPAGFVLVDPPAIRTHAALAKWIRRGVDFAATLPEKRPAVRARPGEQSKI
jgi:TfoX/Sxy family transcriptional regulator of competence genes